MAIKNGATKTATKKSRTKGAKAPVFQELPTDLGVHELWAAFEERFEEVRLPNHSSFNALIRFCIEIGEEMIRFVLDGIDNEGFEGWFREHLNGVLAEAVQKKREATPLPTNLGAADLWEEFHDRVNGDTGASDICDFLDDQPDGAEYRLTQLIEEEGITDEFRAHLNLLLGATKAK